jgi:protein-S-isoprenylcysteine O-methyltransferase Ste14
MQSKCLKKEMIQMWLSLYAYLGLHAIYRTAEWWSLAKTDTIQLELKRDWTAGLIAIPFLLVIVSPIFEVGYFTNQPGYVSWIVGTLFFAAAIVVRTKPHLDLKRAFSLFIEKKEGQKLVEMGLYRYIRHALYLGNLLLFIACSLFLGARFSWIFTLLGLAGILIRIRIEEQFLLKDIEGYREYRQRTWALFPRVF